jgi:hypothetical protein
MEKFSELIKKIGFLDKVFLIKRCALDEMDSNTNYKIIMFPDKVEQGKPFPKTAVEKIFYQNLQRVDGIIKNNTDYTFYFDILFYDSYWDLIKPKLELFAKNYTNVQLAWGDIKEDNIEFWGYKDIFKRLNVFYKTDVAVPFRTPFAVTYYEWRGKDKNDIYKNDVNRRINQYT